jgi:polysaccharide deacetylase 2 family uncharacterized protein YibQ
MVSKKSRPPLDAASDLAEVKGPKTRASISRLAPLIFAAIVGPLLLVGGLLVALLGNPLAGAPRIHMPVLAKDAAPAPEGWVQAISTAQTTAVKSDEPRLISEPMELFTAPPRIERVSVSAQTPSKAPPAPNWSGPETGPLQPAPIAGLFSDGPSGPLPTISTDGRTPLKAYARPFKSDGRPKIALIVRGLGLNARTTQQAIDVLPPEATLSFVPYADGLQTWVNIARAKGHEVLLEVPMEPLDYPDNDPGPQGLMSANTPSENAKRLDWVMGRTTGYFGLTNYLGSKFIGSDVGMNGLFTVLRQRGLAFIDDGSAYSRVGDVQRASADRVVDGQQLSAESIGKQLEGLEVTAKQNGQALGIGNAYPVTIEQLARWSREAPARGYQLAPASALLTRR